MKWFLALLTLIGLGSLAFAPAARAQPWPPGGQGDPTVCAYNASLPTITTGKFAYVQCDVHGQLLTSGGGGGGSTVAGGWLTAVVGTPLAVTNSTTSGTVTGSSSITEVLLTNVGTTNGAYCGVTATATTSYQYIAPSGGWFPFQIASGSNTIACITSTGTTTVNVQTGSGLATGTGGGGGSSASGNVFQATLFVQGTANSSTTTNVVALSGTTTIYLVNYAMETDAAAIGAATFQIITGTGSNCATLHNTLTPVWNFAANAGIQEGSIGVLGASQAGDELCVKTTTTNAVNYRIGVVQQ